MVCQELGGKASRCPASYVIPSSISEVPQLIISMVTLPARGQALIGTDFLATGHDASHRPTTLEVLRTAPTYNDQLFPWPDSEYIRTAHQATQVIEHLQPDLVLVDPLCGFGIDACAKAGARAITLSPVTWSICARVVADKVNQGRFLTWPGYVPLPA